MVIGHLPNLQVGCVPLVGIPRLIIYFFHYCPLSRGIFCPCHGLCS